MEHNLFFALGFDNANLKKEAERLYHAYAEVLRRGDLRMGLDVLAESQAFKQRALAELAQ